MRTLLVKSLPSIVVFTLVSATLLISYVGMLLVQQAGIVERGAVVQVRRVGDDAALLETIDRVARAAGQRVAVVQSTAEGVDVFAAGDFDHATYRQLYPGGESNVRFLAELPYSDGRQVYQLSGPHAFVEELLAQVRGLDAEVIQLERRELGFLFGESPLGKLAVLALLICVAGVVSHVLLRSREIAIWQTYGLCTQEILRRELRDGFRVPLVGAAIGVLAAWGMMFCYSPRLGAFFFAYVSFGLLVGVSSVLLSYLATLVVLHKLPLPARIQGKLPVKATLLMLLALQVGAGVALASFALPAVNYVGQYRTQIQDGALWAQTDDVLVMELSGARDLEGHAEAQARLGDVIRSQSIEGNLIFSSYTDEFASLGVGIGSPQLVMNQTTASRSLPGLQFENRPVLFIPDEAQVSDQGRDVLLDACGAQCELRVLPSNTSVFTWALSSGGWMEDAQVKNPIVTVYPNDQLPDDRTLVAALSQQRLGFTSLKVLEVIRHDADLASFVSGVMPLSAAWAMRQATMRLSVLMLLGGLAVASLLNILLALLAARVYRRVWSRHLFVGHLHGVVARKVVAWCAVLASVVLGGLGGYVWQKYRAMHVWDGLPPGAVAPSMLAELAVSPVAVVGSFGVVGCCVGLTVALVLKPLCER